MMCMPCVGMIQPTQVTENTKQISQKYPDRAHPLVKSIMTMNHTITPSSPSPECIYSFVFILGTQVPFLHSLEANPLAPSPILHPPHPFDLAEQTTMPHHQCNISSPSQMPVCQETKIHRQTHLPNVLRTFDTAPPPRPVGIEFVTRLPSRHSRRPPYSRPAWHSSAIPFPNGIFPWHQIAACRIRRKGTCRIVPLPPIWTNRAIRSPRCVE